MNTGTVVADIMDPHNSFDDVLAHFSCLLDSFPADRNLIIFIDGVDRLMDIRAHQVCRAIIHLFLQRTMSTLKLNLRLLLTNL